MNSRVLALLILTFFIIIPGGLYWYFYRSQVSSIVFLSEGKQPFTVTLEGKFGYTYFPILDRALYYRSTCVGSCILSPIPPAQYTLTLSGSGKVDKQEILVLSSGEKKYHTVELSPLLSLRDLGVIAQPRKGQGSIGKTLFGDDLDLQRLPTLGRSVISNLTQKSTILSLEIPINSVVLDAAGQSLILRDNRGDQYIATINGSFYRDFPFDEDVIMASYENGIWRVLTQSGVYDTIMGKWSKNPRFTDFADLDNTYRIGYIDRKDQNLLSLQNYPLSESIFLLINKKTARTDIVARGKDVIGFLLYNGKLSVIDKEGFISALDISLD